MIAATVAVCTRNRCDELAKCLESLTEQHDPSGAAEVLVVDNASSDGTAAFLHRWRDGGVRRRFVTERHVGLSAARNHALDVATGDVVLFIDDDALAPATWVGMLAGALAAHPEAMAAGGPVVLQLPERSPRWATPAVHHWWSATDHGTVSGPYPAGFGPYGTNMAVRRRDALSAGGFPMDFGRRGRSLLSGEETELWHRLVASGGGLWYEPQAPVRHRVLAERISRRWILRRAWAQGRTVARHHLGGVATDAPVDVRALAGTHVRQARASGRSAADAWKARRDDPGRLVDALGQLVTEATAAAALCTARAGPPRR